LAQRRTETLALAIGVIYLVAFLVQVPRDIGQLGWDSSVGSAFVMPETLVKTGTGGLTLMGSTGQWVPLWFGLLTAGLPLHRELWGAMPTLLFLATAVMVAWSVLQVGNRRVALLALLIGVAASPPSLSFLMAPFSHNVVYPCTALLGVYLIWLTRGRGRGRITAFAVPPLLGVVIGTCLSSDVLLASTAVIPLTLTAILAAARRERRSRLVALSAMCTVAVSIPVAKVTSTTMGSLGYTTLPTPLKIASISELPARAKLLFQGLKALFNGYLGGAEEPGKLLAPLGILSDVVMCAALLALVVFGIVTTARFIASGLRKRSDAQTDAQSHAQSDAPDQPELARSLHIIYWVASAAAACGAFWIAGEGPVTTHYSYYETVVFSVAAVIPLLASRVSPARWLIPVGAAIFFFAGVVGLTGNYLNIAAPLARSAPKIEQIARANHVLTGYSNWADASGLTWGLHSRVKIRPVVECPTQRGVSLCPGFQAYVPSWYAPRQRHTFLLFEANGVDLAAVPELLGKPLAVYSFESMRMYIYPYDIASRFGPASE
jgi:hypothetical protein